MTFAVVLLAVLGIAPGSAHAVLRTWAVYGTVPSATVTDDVNLVDGSGFRMYFTIEDSTPDLEPDPDVNDFSQNTFVVVEFRHPTTFAASTESDPSAALSYLTADDYGTAPSVYDIHYMTFFVYLLFGTMVEGFSSITFNLDSVLPSAPVPPLTSNALPSPPPPLSGFNNEVALFLESVYPALDVDVTHFGELGASAAPILPISRTSNPDGTITWTFSDGTTIDTVSRCAIRCWIDPPLAPGYDYATDGSSRFTHIRDFPTGFDEEFTVLVGGSSLGTFGPGDSVDFTGYPGGGVVEFTVKGIVPSVDSADQFAFPLEVSLDSTAATFTMTSLAFPAVPALPLFGIPLLLVALALSGSALVLGTSRARG